MFNLYVSSGTYSGQDNIGVTFGVGGTAPVYFNLFCKDSSNDVTIDLSAVRVRDSHPSPILSFFELGRTRIVITRTMVLL
jgi:hypothetical protein